MTTPAGAVSVDVLPDLRTFGAKFKAELRGMVAQAGQQAGQEFSKGFNDGAARGGRETTATMKAQHDRFAKDSGAGGKKSGEAYGKGFGSGLGNYMKRAVVTATSFAVAGGIIGIVKGIASIGMTYEDNLNIFQQITKATGAEMDAVAKKARALGADVALPGVSAAGAAEAMTELSKAGLSVQESMDAARGTLQLARVASLSEAQAAEITGNAINAFGLKAGDATMVVDQLAAAANSSSVEVKDVSDSFNMAAAVFSGFQGPAIGSKEAITELNTAIGILGNNGIKGSDAGTSLKQMLLQLTGPSMAAKDAMKALYIASQTSTFSEKDLTAALSNTKKERKAGLAGMLQHNEALAKGGDIAYDANGKMRGLREIIDLTAKGVKGMTDEQRNQALTTIFGADATRSIIALMKGGMPVYDAMRKAVMEQGAAADVAAAKNKGLRGAIDNVKSQFENAAISVYESVKGPLTRGLTTLAERLPAAFSAVGKELKPLGPPLKTVAGFVGEVVKDFAPGVIMAGAAAFGAVRVAVSLLAGVLGPVLGFMRDHTTLMKALAVAVVAGVVAWKTWTTAIKVWSGITKIATAVQAAFSAVMSANPIMLVVIAVAALAAGMIYAYKHSDTFRAIVQKAWQGIQTAASWAWNNVIKPVIAALVTAFGWVAEKATWLWKTVLKPAWEGISAAIKWAWDTIIKPVFGFIQDYVRGLGVIFTWLYNNIVKPIWTLISIAIQVAWVLIEVVFGLIKIGIKILAAVFDWLWKNVIKPVWSAISTAIKWAWDNVLKPTFTAIGGFLKNTLGPAFTWLRDNVIKPVWSAISSAIDSVWKNGIKPVFDVIKNAIKKDVPDAFTAGKTAIGRAWDAVKDVVKAPIKFVVNTVLNDGILSAYNWVAKKFDVKPNDLRVNLPKGFADGGPIPGPVSLTRGDNTLAAVQSGEYIMPVDRTRQFYPLLEAMRSGRLPGFADGGVWGGIKKGASAAFNKGKDLGSDALDFLSKPVEWITNKIKGPLNKLKDIGAGSWGSTIAAIPKKMGSSLIDKIKSVFGADGSSGSFVNGMGNVAWSGSAGVEQWRGVALQALALAGAPSSWIGSLMRRMNQESGGNPNAQNNWDINAKNGVPSQGLMQVIPPTFAAYAGSLAGRGIRDPLANIYAAIKYAVARYGSGPAGWDQAGGYDSGGILKPGSTLVRNDTGKPEMVLNPAQWEAVFKLAQGGDTKKGDFIVNYPPTVPVERAVHDTMRRYDLLYPSP